MRPGVRNVLSTIAVLAITAVLIWALGVVVRPVETDDALDAIDAFHSLPEESVEVIGYGSSHMWRGLDTMELYRAYGIGAYNYGCNWQHINTTALFVKDSFRTQTPKLALIDTYLAGDPLVDTDMDGEIYYTRQIHGVTGKWKYLRQCFGTDKERYLSYFVPLAAFHDNWENLNGIHLRKPDNWGYLVRRMGFQYSEGGVPVTIGDPDSFPQKALSLEALASLDEIVAACRAEGTQILFYTTPWEGEYPYAQAMAEYAARNGCGYIDLFREMDAMGLDCETDFSDPGHLNANGARKTADYLGAYISEHYELTDMRDIPDTLWAQYSK